jgi:hypothetical protein
VRLGHLRWARDGLSVSWTQYDKHGSLVLCVVLNIHGDALWSNSNLQLLQFKHSGGGA